MSIIRSMAGHKKEHKMNKDTMVAETYTINELTVHSGTFHSDDVFCGAVAKILNPDVIIHRVMDASTLENDLERGIIACDIGMREFDHHQADCPLRADGIKHCGASRMWLVYGMSTVRKVFPRIADEDAEFACHKINDNMLRTIAALDNNDEGVAKDVYSIVTIVEGFRPDWDSDMTYDEGYMNAVDCVKGILVNEIKRFVALTRARANVEEGINAMTDGVVVIKKYSPWKEYALPRRDILVMVYPSLRGGWNIEPLPIDKTEVDHRVTIPEEWLGAAGEKAAEMCKGMTFCHKAGFLAAFETKEAAINAAEYLVQNCKNPEWKVEI